MGAKQHAISVVLAGATALAVVHFQGDDAPERADAQASAKPRAGTQPAPVSRFRVPSARGNPYEGDPEEGVEPSLEPQPAAEAANEPRVDRAQAQAAEVELHASLLAESREEARDASWAGPMEASLASSIDALQAEVGSELQNVTCRATSCEATVEFDSYPAAQAGASALVSGIVNRECSKRLTLSEDGGDGPHQATLYFDCDVT